MSRSLETRSIDASTFFTDNDINLSCPTCKGTGEAQKTKPEEAKVESFRPTDEQVEEHSLEVGTDYYRVVGLESIEEECYETEEEAQEALDDEDNWPEADDSSCPDCENGYLVVMWNTIWNTGFRASNKVSTPASIGNVTIFEFEGEIWFGLSGCGQDLSPDLVAAWFECFPDASWVPEEWINSTNLYGGYYGSQAGKAVEDKLFAILKGQYEQEISSAQYNLKRLKEHLKARKAEAKAQKSKAKV